MHTTKKLILTSPETRLTVEGPKRYSLTVDTGHSTEYKKYTKYDMCTSILSTLLPKLFLRTMKASKKVKGLTVDAQKHKLM